MAKKKPAVKISAKKPAVKSAPKKAAKPTPKKEVKMAKPTPAKKADKKNAKPAAKSLKDSVIKAAGKLKSMVAPKGMTKEQLKKLKEKEKAQAAKEKALAQKEAAKAKALAAKEKERERKEAEKAKLLAKKEAEKAKAQAIKEKSKLQADKQKQKDLEKQEKEAAKLAAKQEKEQLKEKLKAEKEALKNKGKKATKGGEEDEEGIFGEEVSARRDEDEDIDEFEEDFKNAKKNRAGSKKYEEEVQIDIFEPKRKYSNALIADLETKIADEIAELREHFKWKDIADSIGSLDFFIDPKNDECIEKGCDNIRTTQSYCRLHYIRNQKNILKKREILKEGKLQEYIEELISKYPPKYIETLLSDLSDDKEFYKVLNELNITSDFDYEEEDFENVVDDDDADDDIGIETISGPMRYEDD